MVLLRLNRAPGASAEAERQCNLMRTALPHDVIEVAIDPGIPHAAWAC